MFPLRDIILTCTYRDCYEQNRLYQQGRTTPGQRVTNIDGVKNKSMHNYNPARAFDFAVVIRGIAKWDKKYYDAAWLFFRQSHLTRKLRWGRNWKGKLKDRPHIEEV